MKPKTWKQRALAAERLKRKHYRKMHYWQNRYWDSRDAWEQSLESFNHRLRDAETERAHWRAMLGEEIDEDRIISGWPGPVMDAITGKAYATPGEFIQAVRDRTAIAKAGGVDVRQAHKAGLKT